MSAELFLGAAVGAWAISFAVRRAVRNLRTHARADKFEHDLRAARDQMNVAAPWRAATEDDAELVALLSAVATEQAALEGCDFKPIGDIVGIGVDGKPIIVVRALADSTGTIAATFTIQRTTQARTLGLASFSDTDMVATQRGPQPRLAEPSFVRRQALAADVAYARLIAEHRTFTGDAQLHQVASRDELIAELTSIRGRVIAWRNEQPSDELLDADLRNVLGDVYTRSGKAWTRRLRDRLPEATLRRP